MPTFFLGPEEIQDPQFRTRAIFSQRAQFAHYQWADEAGRIIYIGAVVNVDPMDPEEPPAMGIEMPVREALEHYKQLGALLQSRGYLGRRPGFLRRLLGG